MAGALIGALRVTLGMDSASFVKDTKRAGRQAQGLKGQIGQLSGAMKGLIAGFGAFGVIQVISKMRDMSRAAIDAAGNLGEEASALGVTTDALQEFRYAATQLNITQQQMDDGLSQLTRRLGDAAQGVKEPLRALQQLGIAVRDSEGKVISAGEAMPLIAEAISKIPSAAERAAITVDLFGRSGQKLAALLEGGSAGVNKLRQAAHDLGIVLSESDIAKADEVADKLAALNYVIEAQQNKKLLENADALLEFEQSVGDLKLQLIGASSTLQSWIDAFDKYNADQAAKARVFWSNLAANFKTGFDNVISRVQALPSVLRTMVDASLLWIRDLYMGVKTWVVDKLNTVWDSVTSKIESVKRAFFGLYDAVVGHSYVPDMVKGVRDWMAMLAPWMVDKAQSATARTAELFKDLRDNLAPLMAELFPDEARLANYRRDIATIDQGQLDGKLTAEKAATARNRALRGLSDAERGPIPMVGLDKVNEQYAEYNKAFANHVAITGRTIKGLGDKAGVQTVRIAKTFQDMAKNTIGALQGLTDSIKGGGFLDILGSALDLLLQLGGSGLLGKNIAANINKVSVPGYAGGTNFHPGGMAVVGERGPELANLPRGTQVFSNRVSRNMMGGAQRVEIVDTTGLFQFRVGQQIMQAAPAIAQGGAQIAQRQATFRQSRRVG